MSAEITIFPGSDRLHVGKERKAVVKIDLRADLYRALGPIAARQGFAVTPFINRIMEGIIETLPLLEGEVPVS